MKFPRLIAAALTAVCIFTLTACQSEQSQTVPEDYPVHAADTVIDHRPKKVVSLAPALTDTLFQLQIAGRVVALSDYCDLPAQPGDLEYRDYPRAGTQQLPDLDTIKELGADLVLMTAQPTDAVALELQQANIDFVVIEPASDLEGIRQNYVDLFRILYGEKTGAAMAEDYLRPFDHKLAEIQSCLEQAGDQKPSTVYLAGDLLQMATGDSFEGYILEFLGTDNWGADYTNYTFPQEREVELDPDVIFYNGMLSGETIAASSCYKTTKAGTAGAIYEIDPENFERQSPDILDTLWTMGKLLYPESFVHNEPGQPWESSPASMGYIPSADGGEEPVEEPTSEGESESSPEDGSSSGSEGTESGSSAA